MKVFGIDIGLLWKLRKAKAAMDKEVQAGFDWKINALKAIKNFLIVAGLTGLIAVGAHFSDVNNLGVLFTWLPESVRGLVQPTLNGIVAASFLSLMNWAKNRKNEIVWFVQVAEPTSAKKISGETASKPLPDAVPIAISVKPAVPPEVTPTVSNDNAGV